MANIAWAHLFPNTLNLVSVNFYNITLFFCVNTMIYNVQSKHRQICWRQVHQICLSLSLEIQVKWNCSELAFRFVRFIDCEWPSFDSLKSLNNHYECVESQSNMSSNSNQPAKIRPNQQKQQKSNKFRCADANKWEI